MSDKNKAKILIIGTGAFAKALTSVLLFNKQNVFVYGINNEHINEFKKYFNQQYDLGNLQVKINCISNNIEELFAVGIDIVIICTPSYEINNIANLINKFINEQTIIVSTSKGLNWSSDDFFYTNILVSKLKTKLICCLLGPTFAIDILEKQRTSINVISNYEHVNNTVKLIFHNEYFNVTPDHNLIAASLLSSFKNTLAIACGLAKALNCSSNTFSAILTLGINEIKKILEYFGCDINSIFNYYGIGDIFLTCTDLKSRNFKFGYDIGKYGVDIAIENNKNVLIEGLVTIKNINKLFKSKQINEYLIISTLIKILNREIEPIKFIDYLWKLF